MINYFNFIFSPINAIKFFLEQKQFYKEAELSNQEFIAKFPELLNLKISTSWSNEEYLGLIGKTSPEKDEKKVLNAIKFLIEELKIKDIRLRLTWLDLEGENGELVIQEIDKKILNYLFSKKISICLNIGPIKTFRYPEMHLPKRVFALQETPKEKEYIFEENNPIAKQSFDYLEKLCILLKNEFDSKTFDKYVNIIQLDNEPKSRFGLHKWLLTDNYMIKTFEIAQKYFPKQKFLINSPFIPYDWTEIFEPDLQLCLNLIKKLPKDLQKKIIIGLNFYNFVPNIPKIPFFNIHPDNYSAFESLYGKIENALKDLPFEYEVSETQFEPWGDKIPFNIPGKSIEHLRYSLLRHTKKLGLINFSRNKKLPIRLWGIENFIANQKNNFEIIDLIKRIQG